MDIIEQFSNYVSSMNKTQKCAKKYNLWLKEGIAKKYNNLFSFHNDKAQNFLQYRQSPKSSISSLLQRYSENVARILIIADKDKELKKLQKCKQWFIDFSELNSTIIIFIEAAEVTSVDFVTNKIAHIYNQMIAEYTDIRVLFDNFLGQLYEQKKYKIMIIVFDMQNIPVDTYSVAFLRQFQYPFIFVGIFEQTHTQQVLGDYITATGRPLPNPTVIYFKDQTLRKSTYNTMYVSILFILILINFILNTWLRFMKKTIKKQEIGNVMLFFSMISILLSTLVKFFTPTNMIVNVLVVINFVVNLIICMVYLNYIYIKKVKISFKKTVTILFTLSTFLFILSVFLLLSIIIDLDLNY